MILKDKVCLVTGVSKGIGLALVQGLLKKDAIVVGFGRTKPGINHPKFHFFTANVRSFDSVSAAYEQLFEKVGKRVDVLINNAGLGYFAYLEDHTIDQWTEMFETNVNGIFYMCKIATPLMKSQGKGHIVNIASTAGIEGYPQVSGYCGSKFAVKGMSQSMYKEMRDFGIKVTCVFPGSVKTDFFKNSAIEPHDYMLMPEDVADMIIYSLGTPDNFHQVNLEVRPLQPKGPKK
ncbi:MAG: NAD(P)-dependent dehydrogenase (short-subunit alcohol dehydrogenase family) [Bacteroidia bacterium]|jgi:NAD(P)-dependent dehydrogenase (short-subunit alcohol dehydrogenase family)